MAQIKVRELEDWILSILRENASLEGHSLEQHLRDILRPRLKISYRIGIGDLTRSSSQ